MIKIHREGYLIVSLTFFLSVGLVSAAFMWFPDWARGLCYLGAISLLILVIRFFRSPKRRPFLDESTIVAPADGKVVAIEQCRVDEFLEGPCIQVSIFMSIHDVHINYYPVKGEISYIKYHPGSYLLARHPKSSELNERHSTGIVSPHGSILVRQIAGYVARRVRSYSRLNTTARQGKEMGFIKFGSRLDLFLPPGCKILIEPGQRVSGSVTPIARFK